jgi:hypothetical protein
LPFGTALHVPSAGLQVPTLQMSLNCEQSTEVPFTQENVERSQVSMPVHAFLSEQSESLVQPQEDGSKLHRLFALLQVSLVHTSLSSQTRAGPPQTPFVHVSGVVQKSPSSQGDESVLFGLVQTPVAGLHVPRVWHWSSAAHCFDAPPVHVPD